MPIFAKIRIFLAKKCNIEVEMSEQIITYVNDEKKNFQIFSSVKLRTLGILDYSSNISRSFEN